ncbi:MAG: sigma-70 family RNA polymerase sigma factor [Planctomycetes bacterium]|nr:sigma-70 family RNA polymerase sigma factor [Planctomycetota bacterium]
MTDWQAVVSRHTALVWQTAYRLLNDYHDADDCVQETFLAAVARRQPVKSWGGLLVRLSTRRALDRLRQRLRNAARCENPIAWSAIASAEAGPEQQAQAAELSDRLRTALAELPRQQAEVVCLRCLSELSYREIARELDVNTAAVGRLLYRARARLRQLLGPAVPEDETEVSP